MMEITTGTTTKIIGTNAPIVMSIATNRIQKTLARAMGSHRSWFHGTFPIGYAGEKWE
jgi:hypothetical protein